jgi:hypothetical protein
VLMGILDVNSLIAISITGALCLGDYSEAAAVAVLFGLSDWIEGRASAGVRQAVSCVCVRARVLCACGCWVGVGCWVCRRVCVCVCVRVCVI